ncbi:MAG: helix-turn-helix domain-containing protein [Saprospiraceae bacterium]|nr:helix-turn-helix domain-containing protein [Saprospiraceae bacterium]MCB9321930.1 helix-turn-helix domain-containing protein [Lewinellaceae bacterium]
MGSINIIQGDFEEFISGIVERVVAEVDKKLLQPKSEEVLSCRQVEELLDISPTTRIAWTKNGILKAHALGSRKYYKRSDIDSSLIPIR